MDRRQAMGTGVAIGAGIGAAFATSMGPAGFAIGIAVGVAIGAAMAQEEETDGTDEPGATDEVEPDDEG